MLQRTDLDINRHVRRILVKHWIDLGRISIRTTRGSVLVYGLLQRIAGSREPLTTPLVESIFMDIKRIKGVRMVRAHLENWSNEGGRWHRSRRQTSLDSDPGPGVSPED